MDDQMITIWPPDGDFDYMPIYEGLASLAHKFIVAGTYDAVLTDDDDRPVRVIVNEAETESYIELNHA